MLDKIDYILVSPSLLAISEFTPYNLQLRLILFRCIYHIRSLPNLTTYKWRYHHLLWCLEIRMWFFSCYLPSSKNVYNNTYLNKFIFGQGNVAVWSGGLTSSYHGWSSLRQRPSWIKGIHLYYSLPFLSSILSMTLYSTTAIALYL